MPRCLNYGYLPAMADILTLMVNKINPSIDYIWHKTFKNTAMGLEFNTEALNKKIYVNMALEKVSLWPGDKTLGTSIFHGPISPPFLFKTQDIYRIP